MHFLAAWDLGKANAPADEDLEAYYVGDSSDEALGSAKNGRPGSANLKARPSSQSGTCWWLLSNPPITLGSHVIRLLCMFNGNVAG